MLNYRFIYSLYLQIIENFHKEYFYNNIFTHTFEQLKKMSLFSYTKVQQYKNAASLVWHFIKQAITSLKAIQNL